MSPSPDCGKRHFVIWHGSSRLLVSIALLALVSNCFIALAGSDVSSAEYGTCGEGVQWEYLSSYSGYEGVLLITSTGGTNANLSTVPHTLPFKSIYVENGITSLTFGTFWSNSSGGIDIHLGKDVASYSNYHGRYVKSYDVDPLNTTYSSADGVLYDAGKTRVIDFPEKSTLASWTIPSTVTDLGWSVTDYGVRSELRTITVEGGLVGAFSLPFKHGTLRFTAEEAALLHGHTYNFSFIRTLDVPDAVLAKTFNRPAYVIQSDAYGVLGEVNGNLDFREVGSKNAKNYSCYSITADGTKTKLSDFIGEDGSSVSHWNFRTDGTDYIALTYEYEEMAYAMEIGIVLIVLGTVLGAVFYRINRGKV